VFVFQVRGQLLWWFLPVVCFSVGSEAHWGHLPTCELLRVIKDGGFFMSCAMVSLKCQLPDDQA
jgi:hypothetical protein